LDFSLVPKNLSQKIPSSGQRPRPGNLGQNGVKPILPMKSPIKNTKFITFQYFLMQTGRLPASFEGLTL